MKRLSAKHMHILLNYIARTHIINPLSSTLYSFILFLYYCFALV